MALKIPHAGLQLEEAYGDAADHLPTQAFVLDLDDAVIDRMIESVTQGHEIRLSLGNTPTFLFGNSSHHIEATTGDDSDDVELFQTSPAVDFPKFERLPQFAMSLFRKPEMGDPWDLYRAGSSEDEDEEYEYELSPEPEDMVQRPSDDVDEDIAALRDSMKQKEAEKQDKATRVIEGSSAPTSGKKRSPGALQKAPLGRRSPYERTSVSPLPASPALSAVGSPSLVPIDAMALQAAKTAKQARLPIIHELAFKEQPYDLLWQKYPGSSEVEFKNALEKAAKLKADGTTYALRQMYWKELDVWNHEYASSEERQQAIDNAIRQYDKMRLSPSEPEWERLLRKDERGQGRVLSKIHAVIAKGPPAAKTNRPQKSEDSGGDSGGSGRDDNGYEPDVDPELPSASPFRSNGPVKKKPTSQEKRLLGGGKKRNMPAPTSAPTPTLMTASAPSTPRVSPSKPSAKSNRENPKIKSEEFVVDSDSSGPESDSEPTLMASVQAKLAAGNTKPSVMVSRPAKKALSPPVADKARKSPVIAPPDVRKANRTSPNKTSPGKDSVRSQITAKPLLKKRMYDDDDDSSSSSSSTPLSKRPKLKTAPRLPPPKDRERLPQARLPLSAPPRPNDTSPRSSNSSSGSGSGSNGHSGHGRTTSLPLNKPKNTSPTKSSPLAASPPANASELDLSSEESVPPIGSSNTNQKRKAVDERRNNLGMARSAEMANGTNGKLKKWRQLPEDVVEQARKFKVYYEKYETLYKDIASRSNPPKDKVGALLAMHHRLQEMKQNIYSEAMVR